MTTQNPVLNRLSAVPRFVWAIVGGVILLALIAAALIFLLPSLTHPMTTLNAANGVYIHPDGLAISLPDPAQTARVRAETLPREVFVSQQGGAEWTDAYAALPQNITPLSPLYTIKVDSDKPVRAEMSIPNGAEPLALLDLYAWDAAAKRWVFVPSEQKPDGTGITFTPTGESMIVMAAHVLPNLSESAVVITAGATDPTSVYDIAMPEGWHINETGEVEGGAAPTTAAVIMPIAQNRLGGFQYDLPDQRAMITDALMNLLQPAAGIVLDFAPSPLYAEFVATLAERVHSHGKELAIIVRGNPDDYDLVALAQHADRFWYAPDDNPASYALDGTVSPALKKMVQRVDRTHVGLLVSGLNVDLGSGAAVPIKTEDALALFGDVQVAGEFDPAAPIAPGSELPVRLTGQVTSMGFDTALGANYLTYQDAGGATHYVYFGSAQSLQVKLNWAKYYGLGAVGVQGLAHPLAPADTAQGYDAFLQNQTVSDPQALEIVWDVQSQSGESIAAQTGDLNLIQYLWKAVTDPGTYTINASVQNADTLASRGQVAVVVADVPTATVAPTVTPTPTLRATGTPNPNATGTPKPQPTAGPVTGSVAAGSFEFGGQTQTFAHPDLMHQAGMKWVKFQHKWNPGDDPSGAVGGRIADARNKGFKVLLSIPGPNHPSSIDFNAYVNFVAGVAALGPDAIEIWNEMNFNVEWPADSINGASYVNNMLAPAYTAIKAANPSVMVISGAPTPTGAFGGCGSIGEIKGCDDHVYIKQMAEAGAKNYMDCMGVHYNEGIISPAQRTGDPRDAFYSRYFFGMLDLYYQTFGKPLCFTELGYLTPEGFGPLPSWFAWAQNTTVAQQAQWLSEAMVLGSQSGKVRLIIIFNVDFTVYGNDPQAGYAIIRPDGSCPACATLDAVAP